MRAVVLTPERAYCSGTDAGNQSMRRAGRKAWSLEDYNTAVETQARLLRHLGAPYAEIANRMVGR